MQTEADLIARRVKREEELIARASRTASAPVRWVMLLGAVLLLASAYFQFESIRLGLESLRLAATEASPDLESTWTRPTVDGLVGSFVGFLASCLFAVFLIVSVLWNQSHARIDALYELLDRAGSLRPEQNAE